MTLVEVLFAVAIFAVVFGTILNGLVQANVRSNWVAMDAAATRLAEEGIEKTQNARWDPTASPVIDELIAANFPTNIVPLDANAGGTNTIVATNIVQIVTKTNASTIVYKVLTSEVRWKFPNRNTSTNSVVTVRCPDQ